MIIPLAHSTDLDSVVRDFAILLSTFSPAGLNVSANHSTPVSSDVTILGDLPPMPPSLVSMDHITRFQSRWNLASVDSSPFHANGFALVFNAVSSLEAQLTRPRSLPSLTATDALVLVNHMETLLEILLAQPSMPPSPSPHPFLLRLRRSRNRILSTFSTGQTAAEHQRLQRRHHGESLREQSESQRIRITQLLQGLADETSFLTVRSPSSQRLRVVPYDADDSHSLSGSSSGSGSQSSSPLTFSLQEPPVHPSTRPISSWSDCPESNSLVLPSSLLSLPPPVRVPRTTTSIQPHLRSLISALHDEDPFHPKYCSTSSGGDNDLKPVPWGHTNRNGNTKKRLVFQKRHQAIKQIKRRHKRKVRRLRNEWRTNRKEKISVLRNYRRRMQRKREEKRRNEVERRRRSEFGIGIGIGVGLTPTGLSDSIQRGGEGSERLTGSKRKRKRGIGLIFDSSEEDEQGTVNVAEAETTATTTTWRLPLPPSKRRRIE